jgi:hypothetical protein
VTSTTATGSTVPEITIHAKDFSYSVPTQILSGLVSLTMINDGQEPHHGQLARLNDNVTMDQLVTTLQQGPEQALGLVSLAGGPGVILPTQKQTVTVNLTPGNYVLLCFVSGQDNVPHLAKGMIAPIQVAAAPAGAAGAPNPSVAEPTSTGTVELQDFSFKLPPTITAGPQVWKVTNNGPEPHEFALLKMEDGKTAQDFTDFITSGYGPPPFAEVGGLQAISQGATAWVNLDLQPGTYIAICFVPSPTDGKPHFEHGMVMPFTVQ